MALTFPGGIALYDRRSTACKEFSEMEAPAFCRYDIPDGFITSSPFSRSIPETFPHVNVTSPYLGKSIFASYTCSFSSSSIVFTRFCLLYPKQDRELKLFFYMRHVSCHTSQNAHVEDKQEKKASSLRITPSEHRHNLRRRSRLLLRSRALRSHRQII